MAGQINSERNRKVVKGKRAEKEAEEARWNIMLRVRTEKKEAYNKRGEGETSRTNMAESRKGSKITRRD